MKVLKLLISLSWCLGVCLQQILWDTLWISWFVQYQLFQISPTTRSLTWSAIWLSWSLSKSSSKSTVLTSITRWCNCSDMWRREHAGPLSHPCRRLPWGLPSRPGASCNHHTSLEWTIENKRRERSRSYLFYMLSKLLIWQISIGLTKGLWFKFDIPADSCLFLSEKMHQ